MLVLWQRVRDRNVSEAELVELPRNHGLVCRSDLELQRPEQFLAIGGRQLPDAVHLPQAAFGIYSIHIVGARLQNRVLDFLRRVSRRMARQKRVLQQVPHLVLPLVASVCRHLHARLPFEWRLDAWLRPASILNGIGVLLRVHVPLVIVGRECERAVRNAVLREARVVACERRALRVLASSYSKLLVLLRAVVEQHLLLLIFRHVWRHSVLDVHRFGDEMVLRPEGEGLVQLLEMRLQRMATLVI